jgi:hypothetical protein
MSDDYDLPCELEYRTMDKVQKPSDPDSYMTSSEPFIIYLPDLI